MTDSQFGTGNQFGAGNNQFGTGVMPNVPTAPTVPTVPDMASATSVKYAGFWVRFVAYMVDALILVIPVTIIRMIISVMLISIGLNSVAVVLFGTIIYLLAIWGYFVLMTYYSGATLGKMLVGITVKSDDLQRLSFGRVIMRETLGKLVSGIILDIGYIMAGFTDRKRALHDMFAKSVVVYKDPTKSHSTGLIVGIIIAVIIPIIVIIGILSSVVLVSLSVAREKGRDAMIASNLVSIRPMVEIYYGANKNSYSQAKDCYSGMFADQNIKPIISNIGKSTSSIVPVETSCFAENSTYAVSAKLSGMKNFCVDSSGYSGNGVAVDNNSKASCQEFNVVE